MNSNSPFPDRKELNKNLSSIKIETKSDYDLFPDRKELFSKQMQDDDGFSRDLSVKYLEEQKEFLWTRVYLKEELDINNDEMLKIKYLPTNEELSIKFICYNKKGLDKNADVDLVNYTNEDDRKVLCLQSDLNRIDKESDDIRFIRTLFKKSIWFEYQIFKKDDLIVTHNDKQLDYIFIDF